MAEIIQDAELMSKIWILISSVFNYIVLAFKFSL
jgi:hypothetical protein